MHYLLQGSILGWGEKSIANKLSDKDITALEDVIKKVHSKLNIQNLKTVFECKILKEAIKCGEDILTISADKNSDSKTKIKKIFDTYLRQDKYVNFFNATQNNQLEKLWEAYIDKYSNLIFNSNHITIENQFVIKRKNREYCPDFIVTDMYGTKTIVEIKTHSAQTVRYDSTHDALYFLAEFSKAVGQIQGYLRKSVLSSNDEKEYFSSAKGMLIIGHRQKEEKKNADKINVPPGEDKIQYYYKTLRDLTTVLNNIEIVYFDDIVNSMTQKLNIVTK